MKVKDLIEILQEYDPEMEVHTSYNYGDYWHTQVAPKVGYVEEAQTVWSEYHRMPKLVDDQDDFEDNEHMKAHKGQRVVIIG